MGEGTVELRETDFRHPVRHFTDRAGWLRYARWLRRHVAVSLSLLPEPPRPALRARVFDRWDGENFSCEKVCFESLPGIYVTGNLFRPAGRGRRRAPAVLCPHGHWTDGRFQDWDARGSVVARCIQLARMGAVVFSWDMVGYNDSCQLPHSGFRGDPGWGLSLMALQTWNSIRAADFVLSLPGVDARKLGVTGASGGATQTFTLAAVDGRVTAAAPVCMISYHFQGGCLCENAPLLRLDATNVEIARLFAPKPLFVGSCTGDWTAETPEVELPAIREVYELYGAGGRVSGLHVDDEHNYNRSMREAVYGFFNRWLLGASSEAPVPETARARHRPPLRKRMVWWGRKAPEPVSASKLRALWRRRCEAALRPHLKSAAAARKALGPLLGHAVGLTLDSVVAFQHRAPATVAITREHGALVVRAASDAQREAGGVQFHDTYNLTPLAGRVHEVLAAIETAGGRVKLIAKGAAGPACLLAAALSRKVTAVEADVAGFDPDSDASWRRHFGLPSFRQVGGLATVFALMGGRPVELHRARPAVRELARKYAR